MRPRTLAGWSLAAILALTAVGCGTNGSASVSSGATWSSTPSATAPSTTGPSAASASPASVTGGSSHTEVTDNQLGTPVFGQPNGAAPPNDVPQSIPYNTAVQVACYVPNNAGNFSSINDYYKIVGGTWNGLWAPANTFANGEPVGPNQPEVSLDKNVPMCRSS